jgi:class 3 adenylate cyclase
MGLHTGEPTLGEAGYLGLDVVRGARIASAAHGGQVLVSETTRALLPADLPGGAEIIDLGQHSLKDLERAEHLLQINGDTQLSATDPRSAEPTCSGLTVRTLRAMAERATRRSELLECLIAER